MSFARDSYTATAAQTDFTISFPYLDEADVLVYVNGTLKTVTTDYTIVTSTIVRFGTGLSEDDTVLLIRSTSQTVRLVDYATASTLTEADLDNDSIQAFYMAQESIDKANTSLLKGSLDRWDFNNEQSQNVPLPTISDSVASKQYVDNVTSVAGNVPTPDNPGDDGAVLVPTAGVAAWTPTAAWFQAFMVDATIGDARTELGLGTAAVKNTGVANGEMPVMDATGYPVADGSQLTNVIAAWADVTGKPAGADPSQNMLHIQDQKSNGTQGGTFTNGAWRTRDLNTEVRSTIAGAGLCFDIAYETQTANFTVGQVLTDGTSGATATIVADADGGATGTLTVIGITGTFGDANTITDPLGGSAAADIPSGVQDANQFYLPVGEYIVSMSAPALSGNHNRAKLYDITNTADLIFGWNGANPGAVTHQRSWVTGYLNVTTAAVMELQHQIDVTRASDGLGDPNGFGSDIEIYSDVLIYEVV